VTQKTEIGVIFSVRDDIRNALRQELKNQGFDAAVIFNARNVAEYEQVTKSIEDYCVLLDWESGPDKILEVLSIENKEMLWQTTPCLLIAGKVDEHILSVAREYNIAKVHVGDVTSNVLKQVIKEFLMDMRTGTPIKKLYSEIEKLQKEEKWEEASRILEEINKKMPDNERVILDLAQCCLEEGKWEEAQQLLEGRENWSNARGKHLLARCHMKKGNREQAAALLQDAQLISPYNVDRLMELGHLFLDLGKTSEAGQAFDEILEFAPESRRGKMGKGTAMLASGEINEAIGLVKGALSPREIASVFNTAAIFAIKNQKFDTGMNLYQTALSLVQKNKKVSSRLIFNKGIGLFKAGKIAEAKEAFENAVALDPGYEDAKFNLKVLQKTKQPATAVSSKPEVLGDLEESFSDLTFNTDFTDDFELEEAVLKS
jgi:tetratricopeptide (TPR) repeat protein